MVLASLGAVAKDVERDEWRIVYDATHGVNLNHRIRVRDQVRMPTWQDLARIMEEAKEDGHGVHFALKYDVSKAHRRVPVIEEEWGLLACRATAEVPKEDDTIYVNKVGTFGVSSAGYWWSRLFALIVRLLFWVTGRSLPLYHLVYSDDGQLIGAGRRFEDPLLIALLFLEALGVPLTWKKVRGGIELEWVGLMVDVKEFRLGLSERRLEWTKNWCERMADSEKVAVKEIQEGLGRLVFVAGPLTYARPFLGPLFAWVAACPLGLVTAPSAHRPPGVTMVCGHGKGLPMAALPRGPGESGRGLPHRRKSGGPGRDCPRRLVHARRGPALASKVVLAPSFA